MRATEPSTPDATIIGLRHSTPHTHQTGSVPGATAPMPAETGRSARLVRRRLPFPVLPTHSPSWRSNAEFRALRRRCSGAGIPRVIHPNNGPNSAVTQAEIAYFEVITAPKRNYSDCGLRACPQRAKRNFGRSALPFF